MGPGPSNCPPQILSANSLPIMGDCDSDFLQVTTNRRQIYPTVRSGASDFLSVSEYYY